MTEPKIRIGLIAGNDSDRAIQLDPTQTINLLGNNDAAVVISLIDDPDITWARLHLSPSYYRKPVKHDLSKIDVLWSLISDADQHPEVLAVAERFVRDFPGAVVNPPSQVRKTRRHQIAERLQGLFGLHMPRTLLLRNPTRDRISRQTEAVAFRFPAILRSTGTHNGHVIALAEDIDGCSAVFGDRKQEYYLTEFVDVRGEDGLYRKSRFFVVGDRFVVRQHIIAEHWNIRGRSSRQIMVTRPDLLEEARGVLHGQFEGLPRVTQTALRAVRDAVGLDYFGIDACMMADGSLTVFEANATMNFNPAFPNPAVQYNRVALAPMIEATRRLVTRRAGERRR